VIFDRFAGMTGSPHPGAHGAPTLPLQGRVDERENSDPKHLLQPLLSPRAVAIVGQSDDATKTAGRPLKYLRQAGYAGQVYPINPRREQVLGERAWRSLADLPEVPDHAYVVTGTDAAIAAVAECGRPGRCSPPIRRSTSPTCQWAASSSVRTPAA